MARPATARGCVSFADVRTDCYGLLAALLGAAPTGDLLLIVRSLAWEGSLPEKVERALVELRRAGDAFPLETIREEFNQLFVGLGSGELVPYASWYREKTLQSTPLAALRSDLRELGIERQEGTGESEDHAGALCEIMALLSMKPGGVPLSRQARFFRDHLAPWLTDLFKDLQAARSAGFYRAVGAFGGCYLDAENEFLASALEREAGTKGD